MLRLNSVAARIGSRSNTRKANGRPGSAFISYWTKTALKRWTNLSSTSPRILAWTRKGFQATAWWQDTVASTVGWSMFLPRILPYWAVLWALQWVKRSARSWTLPEKTARPWSVWTIQEALASRRALRVWPGTGTYSCETSCRVAWSHKFQPSWGRVPAARSIRRRWTILFLW